MPLICASITVYEKKLQRRDSLGSTTKIPRLSKESTRKFKSRRSQSSLSSASDVFAEKESTKGQADLSVCEMKLGSEKNRDGNQRRSAEAGLASETLVDPFDEGNGRLFDPTLSRARTSNCRKSRGQKRPRSVPRSSRERKCYSGECPNRRLRVISGEENFHIQPIPTHLWPSRATTR